MHKWICCTCQIQDSNEEEHLKSSQQIVKLDVTPEVSDAEFLSQVSMVSRLKHENLIQLLGFCVDGNLRVLHMSLQQWGGGGRRGGGFYPLEF
ncbi:hypothetical protein Bca101_007595 [Brassica carinata]